MPEKDGLPILGLDFDDVVFDCNGSIAAFHNERYGTAYGRKDNTTYFFEDVWGVPPEEVERRVYEYYGSDFHRQAPIVEGAKEALAVIRERYRVVVVTARDERWRAVTEAWIGENLPGLVDRTYFTGNFLFNPQVRFRKSDIANELRIAYFVEDALHQAEEIAAGALGTEVLLFDSPWNRAATPPGTTRVRSWREIEERLGGDKADR